MDSVTPLDEPHPAQNWPSLTMKSTPIPDVPVGAFLPQVHGKRREARALRANMLERWHTGSDGEIRTDAMSAALTLILLTTTARDAGDAVTPAIARTAREALGE